jgi:ribose-phosphate pyrophosphokinase
MLVNKGLEHYSFTTYKDGQLTCEAKEKTDNPVCLWITGESYENIIKAMTVATIDNIVQLCISGLIGMRSDRKFGDSKSFDLKVVTNMINSINADRVWILEPHSNITLDLIKNSKGIYMNWDKIVGDNVRVYPDAGAAKRYPMRENTIVCDKVRDETGNPTVTIPNPELLEGKDCFIVDDYCDGGRTFTNLANQLKNFGARTVSLCVTHGLFSYGTDLPDIDMIYSTRSLGIELPGVTYVNQENEEN